MDDISTLNVDEVFIFREQTDKLINWEVEWSLVVAAICWFAVIVVIPSLNVSHLEHLGWLILLDVVPCRALAWHTSWQERVLLVINKTIE